MTVLANDPIAAGGGDAIRYAVSTTPPLVAMPLGLALPLGIWSGHLNGGGTAGFTAAIIVPLAAEFLRRGSVAPASSMLRRRCLTVLTAILAVTPPLSVLGLALAIYGVAGCFGRSCTNVDQPIAIVGLVFAVLAVFASLGLVTFLRSSVWQRHRAASGER